MRIATVSVLLMGSLPLLAQEPTLAELAERQKKARQGAAKVITEADLRQAGPGTANAATGAPASAQETAAAATSAASQPDGKKEPTEEERRAEKRAEIEKKLQELTASIAEERKRIAAVELEMGDLTDYTFGPRRAVLQEMIDESKRKIAEAEQAIVGLQDQARWQGIPISR